MPRVAGAAVIVGGVDIPEELVSLVGAVGWDLVKTAILGGVEADAIPVKAAERVIDILGPSLRRGEAMEAEIDQALKLAKAKP